MPKMLLLFLLSVAWVGTGLLGAAAINATFRVQHPRLFQSERMAHMERNGEVITAIAGPVVFVAAAIFTGGFYDGFTLTAAPIPCTDKHPEIWCKP